MSRDYIPSQEARLVTWSTNLKLKTAADAVAYGLTVAMATAYGLKHDAFVAAYQLANDPETRSPSNIKGKDLAKATLIQAARQIARLVQASPVTDQQREELGLPVRDAEPTPVGPPAQPPLVTLVSASGRTIRIRLQDPLAPTRRGKPAGVAGAAVFSFVGETPPPTLADWRFEGNTSRTTVDVAFPASVPNWSKVWIAARWFTARLQDGPASAFLEASLPGGNAAAA